MENRLSEVKFGEKFVTARIIMLADGGYELRELHIPIDEWLALDIPAPPAVLDNGTVVALYRAEANFLAYEAALRMLAYGDNSSADLLRKLRLKKHSKAAAEYAVSAVKEQGYINDRALLCERILALANEKWHGRRKIVAELSAKGYNREEILDALSECEREIDFELNKARLVKRRFGDIKSLTREEKEKVRAFLYRNGY